MTVPAHSPPDGSNVVLLIDLDDTLYQSEELRNLCASNIRREGLQQTKRGGEEERRRAPTSRVNRGPTACGSPQAIWWRG